MNLGIVTQQMYLRNVKFSHHKRFFKKKAAEPYEYILVHTVNLNTSACRDILKLAGTGKNFPYLQSQLSRLTFLSMFLLVQNKYSSIAFGSETNRLYWYQFIRKPDLFVPAESSTNINKIFTNTCQFLPVSTGTGSVHGRAR